MLLLLSALLLAAAPDEAGAHVGIAVGVGGAEDLAGAHLQFRYDHLAVFAAPGCPCSQAPTDTTVRE